MILIIDNYDSFTYNIYQYIGELSNEEICVFRNDCISISDIIDKKPSHIILSPGPGYPKDAGITEDVVREFGGKIPILGICLGHQAIAEVYGGSIIHAKSLVHGKKNSMNVINSNKLFKGISSVFEAGRYHSLTIDASRLPDKLIVTAESNDGEIMGIKHEDYDVYGLQFHPESVLTDCGKAILKNFINI